MRPFVTIVLVPFVMLLSGCAPLPVSEVDVEAEQQTISRLRLGLFEAEKSKDLDAALRYFSDDAILQPPDAPQIEGIDEIRALLKQEMFQLPLEDVESGHSKIVVSLAGDLAYQVGWYRVPFDGPEGRVVNDGKYIIVWQKVEGQWKYVASCWNSNRPSE